jgi:hypothetical protein
MKKIIFSLLCVGLLFGACEDRLDIPQKGVIATDTFYKTDEDAESACNNLYTSLQSNIYANDVVYVAHQLLFNLCGDDYWQGGGAIREFPETDEMNNFNYDENNDMIFYAYQGLYGVIYDCNLVLGNIQPDSQIKTRVIAEARALRAWAHLMLTIGWGNPPLVDKNLTSDAQPANYEGGHDGLLEWCATEAETAAADLPERASLTDKVGASRVMKGFAQTVAGKARLFKGDYEGAKKNLKAVISSGKYDLVDGTEWANIFHASGDLSKEMIFQINLVWDSNVGFGFFGKFPFQMGNHWNWATRDKFASQPTFDALGGWGAGHIRADFAEDMLANDGDSYRRKATFFKPDEFLYEMEWNGGAGLSKEELEVSPNIGIKSAEGLFGEEGYFGHKMIVWPEDIHSIGVDVITRNFTLYRYAEVLLMYAEACAMTNDSDGLQYLQKVQNRAGSKTVSTALTAEAVQNEKRFEMWLEGVRWPDMVRLKQFDRVKNNGARLPVTFDAFFYPEGGRKKYDGSISPKSPVHKIEVDYKTDYNTGKYGFKEGIHEYFAFPYESTSINPNIVQNPSGTYMATPE